MVMQAPAPTWLAYAKRRDQPLASIVYDGGAGGPQRRNLRNTGYLDRLRLIVAAAGTYSSAGPTGVDAFGRYAGPIQRIVVEANSVAPLFDCEGFAAALISAIDRQYRYGGPFTLDPDPAAFTASPGTSAFANKWGIDIPIALDLANKPYPYGLFQTALHAQEVTLAVRFNDVSGAAGAPGSTVYTGNPGNLTNETGSVQANQIYYDPIAPPEAQPFLGVIHQWRSWRYPLTADGEVEIPLPPKNLYLRIGVAIVMGGSGALALNDTALTRFRLLYGGANNPDDYTNDQLKSDMAAKYGAAMLDGVFILDRIEETHTERDAINAEGTTDLRLGLTLSGGSYAGGAYAMVFAEQLIPLTVPGRPVAGVQGVG